MRSIGKILNTIQVGRLFNRLQQRQLHEHAAILALATSTPEHRISQTDALNVAVNSRNNREQRSLLEKIYSNQQVEHRYTPIHPDYLKYLVSDGHSSLEKSPEYLRDKKFFFPEDGSFEIPLDQRLQKANEVAATLAKDAASKALQISGVNPADIGHIVLVSCTDFSAPTFDLDLIRHLGLNKDIERTFVKWMACGGGIHSLFVANDFVLSNPGKKALVICAEMTSMMFSYDYKVCSPLFHALFGDGCAAMIVGAADEESALPKGSIKLVNRQSVYLDGSGESVVLSMAPNGLKTDFLKNITKALQKQIKPYLNSLLMRNNISQEDIEFWALHPGGVPVMEAIQKGLDVNKQDLSEAWEVLRDYGNMGGPTVLFVFDKIIQKHRAMVAEGQTGFKHGIALAITPGATIDGFYVNIV